MVQIFLFFRLTWKFLDLSRPTVREIMLRNDGELLSARKKTVQDKANCTNCFKVLFIY